MSTDNPFADLTSGGNDATQQPPTDKVAPKPEAPKPKVRPAVPVAKEANPFAGLRFDENPQPTEKVKEKSKKADKNAPWANIGWIIAAIVVVVLLIGSLWWYVKGSKPVPATAKTEETAKVEPVKVEAPKVEAPKATPPKVEAPKVEAPKVEAPKAAPPKVEPPKAAPPVVTPPTPAKRQIPKGLNHNGETDVTEEWDAKITAEHAMPLASGGRIILSPYARLNKGFSKNGSTTLYFYITEGDQEVTYEGVSSVKVGYHPYTQPHKVTTVSGTKTVRYPYRALLVLTIQE